MDILQQKFQCAYTDTVLTSHIILFISLSFSIPKDTGNLFTFLAPNALQKKVPITEESVPMIPRGRESTPRRITHT